MFKVRVQKFVAPSVSVAVIDAPEVICALPYTRKRLASVRYRTLFSKYVVRADPPLRLWDSLASFYNERAIAPTAPSDASALQSRFMCATAQTASGLALKLCDQIRCDVESGWFIANLAWQP